MALLGQGQLARLNITNMRQPILDELARQSKELVRLTELRNNGLVWIGSARAGGARAWSDEPDMNERIVPFATANGKAWLSTLSWDDAARIALDTGLGRVTLGPGTVTTLEQLRAELDRTRARGYGLALEEAEEGVGAVAVAVATRDGVVGTMSVAAPIWPAGCAAARNPGSGAATGRRRYGPRLVTRAFSCKSGNGLALRKRGKTRT